MEILSESQILKALEEFTSSIDLIRKFQDKLDWESISQIKII